MTIDTQKKNNQIICVVDAENHYEQEQIEKLGKVGCKLVATIEHPAKCYHPCIIITNEDP